MDFREFSALYDNPTGAADTLLEITGQESGIVIHENGEWN